MADAPQVVGRNEPERIDESLFLVVPHEAPEVYTKQTRSSTVPTPIPTPSSKSRRKKWTIALTVSLIVVIIVGASVGGSLAVQRKKCVFRQTS